MEDKKQHRPFHKRKYKPCVSKAAFLLLLGKLQKAELLTEKDVSEIVTLL